MQKLLGWPDVKYTPRNVNRRQPKEFDLFRQDREMIRARNQYDVRLYDYVADQLDDILATTGIEMKLQLWQLRASNFHAKGRERLRLKFYL